jgi:hypothetical protein
MIAQDSVLVQLVRLIERLPSPPYPAQPRRPGRPRVYQDTLFLKALVIMIVRRLHKVGELLAVLEEPTPEMCSLRKDCSARTGASLPGALSSGGFVPCPRPCPRGSVAWGATWWR